jgi:diguanylate cyclase (GGDEF)-like protein
MASSLPDPSALLSIIDAPSEIAVRALDVPASCELVCHRARGLTGAEVAILRLDAPVACAAAAGFREEGDGASRLSVAVRDGLRPVGTLEVQARWPDAFDAVDRETLTLLAGVAGAEVARGRAFERALRELHEDPLTALPNRRAFDHRLGQEVDRAMRYGRALSLVIVTVDGLPELCERHGHHAGDDALLRVAHALLTIRSSDDAFRIAPSEFAVLAPETAAARGATCGARLRAGIRARRAGVPGSVTIGVAQACGPDHRRLEADARAALARNPWVPRVIAA